MENTTTTAQTLADELNAYQGENFWQDVVENYDLDRDAIEQADPSGMSTVVILDDGSEVRYNESRKEWAVTK
jgi:hypothetical protein